MRRTNRVLIVDDDHDAREALAALLARSGFSVAIGRSVSEACGLLSVFNPSVVLSDINMPDEDGFDLMKKLRAAQGRRGRRVAAIAISGWRDSDVKARALAAGFDLFLIKPTPPGEIVAAVRRAARIAGTDSATGSSSAAA